MKADISRVTFDPRRHATGVRKQQGRVDLDADFNEQRDIDWHLRSTSLVDVIGPAGAPIDDDAFAITATAADLILSAGRYYLAGTVCENEQDVSLFKQPDLPAAGPFVRLATGAWVDPPGAVPAGVYVAWLDVWQQHRTTVEDPTLREVALNGPDTVTRTRTVWQVRLLQAGGPGSVVGCADIPPGWAELTSPSTGTIAAWADPAGLPPNDCTIPIGSPYRGLDNQLYRVEIHDPGAPGAATYVWSRNNGALVVAWQATDVDTITVKSPGHDGSDGFTNGCWVELTDDRHEQLGLPGTLVQVDRAEGDRLVLRPATATGTIDHAKFSGQPRARRWDGTGTVPAAGAEVALELGITTRFAADPAARYATGDYWSFPARSATHDVEWPRANDKPLDLLAHGPRHRHGRLGVLAFDGTAWTLQRDCRPLFAPLVDQLALSYLGGDTQQALPDVTNPATLVALGEPLAVGVANGGRPIAGARVRFKVVGGGGRLGGAGGGPELVLTTSADGVVRASWELESSTDVQAVSAVLLAEDGTPRGIAVEFSAGLARASGVAYEPSKCPNLAGTSTVQMALDRLCGLAGGGCDTLSLSPGTDWATALESLPPGDATVCFRPGEYKTNRPVTLRDLANIRLSGGGAGTRLVGTGTETVLLFEHCASVTLQNIAVEVQAYREAPEPGMLGAVTVRNGRHAELHRVQITCPADASSRATCLTVIATGDEATQSVRVRDCEFVVGHAQTGVLVVNADRAIVSGSRFSTPALPETLSLGALLVDANRLAAASRLVAGRIVVDRSEQVDRGTFNTALRVQDFVVRLNSVVPEQEWRALVANTPPAAADVASTDAVTAYVHRLVDGATNEPARVPTFARQLRGLQQQLGAIGSPFLEAAGGKAAARALLAGDSIEVRPAAELTTVHRSVNLRTAGGAVRFDSPEPEARWEAALASIRSSDTSPSGIAKNVDAIAKRVLLEPDFSARFMPGLLDRLRERVQAVARCGVRIAGRRVGDVTIEGNTMTTTMEGIHVAAASRETQSPPRLSVRSARIRGNDVELAVPFEVEWAPRAVFVGNAERIVVADNRVGVADERRALAGIHLEGQFGPHIAVRDNELDSCHVGIRVVKHGAVPAPQLWVVADNIALGSAVVVAPPAVRDVGNVG